MTKFKIKKTTNKQVEDWSYKVIKNAISQEYLGILDDYFYNKQECFKTMSENGYIDKDKAFVLGEYNGEDGQPGIKADTFGMYGDVMADMLMLRLHPLMEEETGMTLTPSYSYMRIYQKGDTLEKHIDRPACEISTTLNISGEPWPIFLKLKDGSEDIKVDLEPGDLLIYKGCEQEHWREEFEGEHITQAFLHYTNVNGPFGLEWEYDKRPHLGLPAQFRKV